MTIMQQEREHLALSDRHIATCERNIAEQLLRIERLRVGGHDTVAFDGVLSTTRELLAQHRAHRDIILRQIVLQETDAAGLGRRIKGGGTGNGMS